MNRSNSESEQNEPGTVELVYHSNTDLHAQSPFDERAMLIAADGCLRIACPYLSPAYLTRLTQGNFEWRLLTDLEEVFCPLNMRDRLSLLDFISRHASSVRHSARLHAKVLIGMHRALVGSANFTRNGIQCRTEMCVYFEHTAHIATLVDWFDALWKQSDAVLFDRLNEYIKSLPEPAAPPKEFQTDYKGFARDAALAAC